MKSTVLDPEDRAQIVSILQRHLEGRCAALLQADPRTIYRAGLGLPLRRHAAESIRARLKAIAAAESAAPLAPRKPGETELARAAAKRVRNGGLPVAARELGVPAAEILSAALGDELPADVAARLERALLSKGAQ